MDPNPRNRDFEENDSTDDDVCDSGEIVVSDSSDDEDERADFTASNRSTGFRRSRRKSKQNEMKHLQEDMKELKQGIQVLKDAHQKEIAELHSLISGLVSSPKNDTKQNKKSKHTQISPLYDSDTKNSERASLLKDTDQGDHYESGNDDGIDVEGANNDQQKPVANSKIRFDVHQEEEEFKDEDKDRDIYSEEEEEGRVLSTRELNRRKSRALRHNNRDIQDEYVDDDDRTYIPHDIFSTLMIARYNCSRSLIPPFFSWAVAVFQVSAYSLIFTSIFDPAANHGNVFGFPANVDKSTRAAEVIAIIIAVATEEDTRTAILLWYDGYTATKYVTGDYVDRRVSFFNWNVSVCLRGFVGLFDIVMTFLLIMRSEEVVDLLLNFTAVQFVSSLDDVAFILANQGFVGRTNQKETHIVNSTYYFFPHIDESKKIRGHCKIWRMETFRIFLYLMVFLPLIVSWKHIVDKQQQGDYSCGKIFVQFGDDVQHNLGALSGEYKYVEYRNRFDYSLIVDDEKDDVSKYGDAGNTAKFRYCEEEEVWTLSYGSDDTIEPCDNWIARSSADATFWSDITAAATSTWFVKNDKGKEIIMDHFSLFCSDANEGFCGKNANLTEKPTSCVCKDGWYGLRCDFLEPCSTLAIDTSGAPFFGFREWSQNFTRLQNLKANEDSGSEYVEFFHHPVYIGTATSESTQFEVMIFTGRRWILTSTEFLKELGKDVTEDRLITYLDENFHPMWSNYTVAFVSEPVDVDTSTDSITPVRLKWFRGGANSTLKSVEFSQEIETTLLCATCSNDNTNPCLSGGTCRADNSCDCSANGASGVLCQILPVKNGFCDVFFNKIEYNFDGGDCCQASCVSGEFKCGHYKEHAGYRGYCNCEDSRYKNCPGLRDTCWVKNGEPIFGETDSADSGASIALSADARIIAVGEPGSDSVRLFQNDGFNWIQLGEKIRGEPGSSFGEMIALSGDGKIIAVASRSLLNNLDGLVSIFEFFSNGWKKAIETRISSMGSMEHNTFEVLYSDGDYDSDDFSSSDQFTSVPNLSPSNLATQNSTDPTWEENSLWDDQFTATSTSFPEFLASPSNEPDSFDTYPPTSDSTTASYLALSHDGRIIYIGTKNWDGSMNTLYRVELNKMSNTYSVSSATNVTPSLSSFDSGPLLFSVSSSGHMLSYGSYGPYGGNVVVQVAESLGTFRQLGGGIPGRRGLLSGDGRVLVVSLEEEEYTQFQAYYLEQNHGNTESEWIKQGGPINGTVKAVSFDGLTLATTTDDSAIIADKSLIHTYFWNGREWAYQDNITTSLGVANVVLAGGKNGEKPKMGVGVPSDASLVQSSGETVLYQFKENDNVEKCERRNLVVRLELTTDAHPNETIWMIRDYITKKTLLTGGPYDQDLAYSVLANETLVLPSITNCAEFVIYDLGGNGLCCNAGFGSYSLYFGGMLQKIGGKFAWSETHRLGECQTACAEGRSQLTVSLSTDNKWEFTDKSTGIVLLKDGAYKKDETSYGVEACIPSSVCAVFTIHGDDDGNYGSYKVFWNKTLMRSSNAGPSKEELQSTDVPKCNVQAEKSSSAKRTSLNVTVTTNSIPIGKYWVIYSIGSKNTTLGNHSENMDIDLRHCYLFEVFDLDTSGVSSPGGYSVFLDGEMILSGDSFFSGYSYLIGGCANVTSYHTTSPSDRIMCSDEFLNSCRAPVSCAKSSIIIEPVGENVLGTSLIDGEWTSNGAYLLAFGSDCNVTCTGSCNSVSRPRGKCRTNEMLLRLQLHISPYEYDYEYIPSVMAGWNVSNDANANLLAGKSRGAMPTIANDQVCIPKDSCSFFTMIGRDHAYFTMMDDYVYDSDSYYLYLDGEYFTSGSVKHDYDSSYGAGDAASETICPYRMRIPIGEGQPSSSNSNYLCDDIELLSVGQSYSDSTENTVVDYVPKCGASTGSVSPGVWLRVFGTGGTLSASLCASDFDTQISVFQGPCDSLTCMEGNDDSPICDNGLRQSVVTWDSLKDAVYFLYVHGYADAYGNFSIVVSEVVRPANDVCANATDLNFQGTIVSVSGSTDYASHDAAILCDGTERSRSPGVWYSVIGTGAELVASLCDPPEEDYFYFSQISIFTGSCDPLICIEGDVHGCGLHLQVVWQSTAATTYYILVHGMFDTSGNFQLTVQEVPEAPPNDFCRNAEKLEFHEAKYSSTQWATVDSNVRPCKDAYQPESPGVWYLIEGTGNNLEVDLCDNITQFDTQLSVFSGSCDTLSCVGGNDDACGFQSAVQWLSDSNTIYYILVHGFSSNRGNFSIIATLL